ncbi:phytase-like protein with esterase activity [Sediminihabitans luteus]|uniref:Phytase-like protein with esterase activity n=1 Tax=Sediminihabitans luteus TaxID=1138585 RepID=A0A2M9CD43_9CELL|nr:esterase-like activity of phytase family protein [Sediminihabitans luteus]PJJ69269.1 phytase-like protein with esterase activity [Sediminihabitans luteus]GII98946.1 hypothetical protein Slu03_13240 [Sediminihabitans luteus]
MHPRTGSRRARVSAAFVAAGLTLVPTAAIATTHAAPSDVAASTAFGKGQRTDAWTTPKASETFHRLATYPVFQNRPDGEPATAESVAEISSVSKDGKTLVYTDALGKRIGFLDISDPDAPRGLGTLSLAELGDSDDQPTSVAVVGDHVLVVVDTSTSFTEPTGRVDVVSLATRERVRSIDLGGQPDSIAVTADGTRAAIAIENERDEEATPAGGDEGDLPQLPAGFVQLLDLTGDVAAWTATPVALTADDGTALPALAGLDTPIDPEPEYVAINPAGTRVAVTLQENNGVVVLDVRTGEIVTAFSAGTASVTGIDTAKDGAIDQTGSITDVPREPDAIAWVDDQHVATANEGDWKGGTRGWTIFDAATGEVTWDAGAEMERLAVRVGLHTEDRAAKKGVEIEGIAVARFGRTPYAFVGSERSNFVAVYDVSKPAAPRFVQVIATTNGPEGLLPVPSRNLLITSSETDEADAGVRAAVGVFGLGQKFAKDAGTPQFPSVVSADSAAGAPIGWTALGALSADPTDAHRLWTASDAALVPTTLFSVDLSTRTGSAPATIDRSVVVTDAGTPAALDVEGLWARPEGGFWLGVEGAKGKDNALVRTDAAGAVQQRVALPADVAAGLGKWGVEGVTGVTDESGDHLFVALQRGLTSDDGVAGYARIGRYDVTAETWTWFGYPLEQTMTDGDWIGLSEVTAVDADTLAVVERDKLNGPAAAIKRVYTVDLPAEPSAGVTMLDKSLAIDALPALQATEGWTQEKLEGLTIAGDGRVYAVTDNDGLKDATGETVLLELGSAKKLLGGDGSVAREVQEDADGGSGHGHGSGNGSGHGNGNGNGSGHGNGNGNGGGHDWTPVVTAWVEQVSTLLKTLLAWLAR